MKLSQQIQILERLANKKALEQAVEDSFSLGKSKQQAFADIIEMNRDMLEKGRNNEGNLVGRYKPATEYFARQDGIEKDKTAGEPYNFWWTGKFQSSLRVDTQVPAGVVFEIKSDIPYLDAIQELGSRNRAQGKLLGIAPEHRRELVEKYILPNLRAWMRLKFEQSV